MRKIELSIAPDYVPNWTIVDAVRELFQNALDQAAQGPEYEASWNYNKTTETLRICNKKSSLTTNSLLFGSSIKAGDVATIGEFGEGYKLATLVLLRNNKQVTFYNAVEIWRPRFVKSRRFNNTNILTFFIDKADKHAKDMIVEIRGITNEEYNTQIVPSNLHLRDDYTIVEHTDFGDVIDLQGKVFVNGLFICDYAPYQYGYNFRPEYITLDRDRKLISDFNLKWLASKMWSNSPNVLELVMEDAVDVAYIADATYSNRYKLYDSAHVRFIADNGQHSVPVTNQAEFDEVPSGYNPVIVNDNYKRLITSSNLYEAPAIESTTPHPIESLAEWYDEVRSQLDKESCFQFECILQELRDVYGE